jgi:hypothetical protein
MYPRSTGFQMIAITIHNAQYSGVSINSLRSTFRPELFVRGDACAGNGCGVHLSVGSHEGPIVEQLLFRWTIGELQLFRQLGTTINCMEFVAALYKRSSDWRKRETKIMEGQQASFGPPGFRFRTSQDRQMIRWRQAN